MILHGCESEVVQHNVLNPGNYQRDWKINHNIRIYKLPSIIPIKKEQSTIYQMWQNQKAKHTEEKVVMWLHYCGQKSYKDYPEILIALGL